MRGSRGLVLIRGVAIAAIAALGAGSAALAPVAGVGASGAAAAVQVVPFATGHILAAGHMKQAPTTAQCEADFGIACYEPFQLQKAYNLSPLFSRWIEGQGETPVPDEPDRH